MRRRIRRLSSQILLAQMAILVVSTGVAFALFALTARGNLDAEFQARAAAIAQTFAGTPSVQECVAAGGGACASAVQAQATATSETTGAAYVVVIDLDRVRLSHPDPSLIGKKVGEPLVVLDGRDRLGIDTGSTGVTANARVPLYGATGAIVGEVSVGIRESSVSSDLLGQLPSYLLWVGVALAIGTAASFALARRLKRRTFGLELDEIAHLLHEREATLHGIREGVIALDPGSRITVLNDHARRLLGLPVEARSHRLDDVLRPGPLRDLLTGDTTATDEIIVTDDHCLVINRMPVTLGGRPHGTVVTLRDRTDVEGLARELAGERSLTESLRAQQHEFSNRLHTISGLLELGRASEALEFIHETQGSAADLDLTLRSRIRCPQIVGLMLGKVAEANERGVELTIDDETNLGELPARVQALTTILGNLIDNAFDALASLPAPRRITVGLVETAHDITIVVADNGPGVAPGVRSHIFTSGFTTKRGLLVRHSGLGLSLVQNTVAKLGGTVTVSEGPGASFTVRIPQPESGQDARGGISDDAALPDGAALSDRVPTSAARGSDLAATSREAGS